MSPFGRVAFAVGVGVARLGVVAAAVVGLSVGVAAAQTDPTAPEAPASSAAPEATTTTVRPTTTTACEEPQPQFPFVGQVLGRQGDVITFGVLSKPEGSPVPVTVPVLFPDQGRYLDDGARYRVVALGPDPAVDVDDNGLTPAPSADPAATAPAVLPALLQGRVRLDDGQCGALTVHEDGSTVDTAVLKPLAENWRRLAWSVLVPVLAAVAVLALLVAGKRLVTRVVLGPEGPRAPTRRPRPRPSPPPSR